MWAIVIYVYKYYFIYYIIILICFMARERLTTRHWLLTKIKVKLGVLFIEFNILGIAGIVS